MAAVSDQIRQDLTVALRSFAKNRTFLIVAALTLALGIGAAATVFAAVHGVLLRGLPVAREDRLVLVRKELPQDGTLVPFGYADLHALREKTHLVEDVGGVQYDGAFPWVVAEGDRAISLMGPWCRESSSGCSALAPRSADFSKCPTRSVAPNRLS